MVSGLINQMLTTTNWGELDYLILDMPPVGSLSFYPILSHAMALEMANLPNILPNCESIPSMCLP